MIDGERKGTGREMWGGIKCVSWPTANVLTKDVNKKYHTTGSFFITTLHCDCDFDCSIITWNFLQQHQYLLKKAASDNGHRNQWSSNHWHWNLHLLFQTMPTTAVLRMQGSPILLQSMSEKTLEGTQNFLSLQWKCKFKEKVCTETDGCKKGWGSG